MTLETESLSRELKAEIGRISDRVDRHDSVIESHHREIDDARALRALVVDALKRIDALAQLVAAHDNVLRERLDAPSPASPLEALVAGLRAENQRLKRELENVGRGQDRAEANEKELHAENVAMRSELPHDWSGSSASQVRRLAELYWAVVRWAETNDRGALLNALDAAKEQK